MVHAYITQEIEKAKAAIGAVLADKPLLAVVEQVAAVTTQALKAGHKLVLAGNGGSAADAQHLAAEMVGRLSFDRPALPAIAITTDSSALTAIGNDYSYDYVFARQIEALGQKNDVFFAISTSGNSANILKALEAARKKGMVTVGFSGKDGGKMPPLCDYMIIVPADETPHIQECHIMLGHIICALAEKNIFGK